MLDMLDLREIVTNKMSPLRQKVPKVEFVSAATILCRIHPIPSELGS